MAIFIYISYPVLNQDNTNIKENITFVRKKKKTNYIHVFKGKFHLYQKTKVCALREPSNGLLKVSHNPSVSLLTLCIWGNIFETVDNEMHKVNFIYLT